MRTNKIMAALMTFWLSVVMLAPPLQANFHNKPQDPAVLLFSVQTNGGEPKVMNLDLETLRAIGEVTFTTHTIWTEGAQVFTGVPLAEMLRHYGITTGTIRVYAINDYSVEFPVEEALSNDALIAYERNGAVMSLRDKGPLWLVYPFDDDKRYQSEVYYSRSIWQMTRIDVIV